MTTRTKRLSKTVRIKRDTLERLRSVGGQMANLAFNWSQSGCIVGRLTDQQRLALDSLRREWDAVNAIISEEISQ